MCNLCSYISCTPPPPFFCQWCPFVFILTTKLKQIWDDERESEAVAAQAFHVNAGSPPHHFFILYLFYLSLPPDPFLFFFCGPCKPLLYANNSAAPTPLTPPSLNKKHKGQNKTRNHPKNSSSSLSLAALARLSFISFMSSSTSPSLFNTTKPLFVGWFLIFAALFGN